MVRAIVFAGLFLLSVATAHAQADSIVNYRSSPSTVVQVSPTNPLPVTSQPVTVGGLTPVSTAALAANLVVKSGAGNLYSFEVAADPTLSGASWWVLVFDATSAPADGPVTPLKCYAAPSGTTAMTSAFPTPIAFTTGLVISASSTGCFNKTASVHAFISGDAK